MIASDKLVTYMWILLAVYAAVILFFVVRGARKNTSIKDYAIGNIGFPSWVVGLSLILNGLDFLGFASLHSHTFLPEHHIEDPADLWRLDL